MINEKELLILYKKKKRQKILILTLLSFVAVGLLAFGIGYFYKEQINEHFSKPEIELNTKDYTYKNNCFEIGASECDNLELENLIQSFNSSYKRKLGNDKKTLKSVDSIIKKEIGSYELIFVFSNQYHSIKEKIKIKIIDDIAPILELSIQSLEININDTIDYQSYVTEASDNHDDLSLSDVIYSEINTAVSGEQTINYVLQDDAGNETSKDILVTIKQPVSVNSSSTNTDNSKTENNDTSGSVNKSSSTSKNKYFSGNSIDVYNQALDYAEKYSTNGYEIMPDGKGFQVTFY